jgi:hypothetical protein
METRTHLTSPLSTENAHGGVASDNVIDDASHCHEPVSSNPSFMAVFIHAGNTGHPAADMLIHFSALSPVLTKLPSEATAMNEMVPE